MITDRRLLKHYLYEDRIANGLYLHSAIKRFCLLRLNKLFRFHTLLRHYEYHSNCFSMNNWIGKLIHIIPLFYYYYQFKRLSYNLGFTIHKNCFGPGLCIRHYGLLIVNPHVKIGRYCIIHSGVNIGELNGKAPSIGDNVYIGPGAKIWGDIRIGNNVKIGANAVVFKSFLEDNITLVGIPAKKVYKE